ncbi:hypothetical protein BaRGS_00021203 [Batillaria attramentaria]|uniref:Uncharacterized protein n=1 Tax=Batillaria attramentaria TaxID=370345 RepID=A0ABD0KK81_9CAEN
MALNGSQGEISKQPTNQSLRAELKKLIPSQKLSTSLLRRCASLLLVAASTDASCQMPEISSGTLLDSSHLAARLAGTRNAILQCSGQKRSLNVRAIGKAKEEEEGKYIEIEWKVRKWDIVGCRQ